VTGASSDAQHGSSVPELTVAIAAYNERATIMQVLERVLAVPVSKEVIIVDNCSTDGTRELLSGLNGQARVVLQPRNMGKGTSIRTAIAHARGTYFIIQDADLEYEPEQYPRLLEYAREHDLDALYGSRVMAGRNTKYLQYYVGVQGLTWMTNLLYGAKLTDVATACKMYRTSVAKQLNLRCAGFDLDFELTNKICRDGWRIGELPIPYHPRTFDEGKKIRSADGLRAAYVILRDRFIK
jgi:dolichol-phosphate mannosyltransferase